MTFTCSLLCAIFDVAYCCPQFWFLSCEPTILLVSNLTYWSLSDNTLLYRTFWSVYRTSLLLTTVLSSLQYTSDTVLRQLQYLTGFYRASVSVRPSVRLSVTSRCSTKMATDRIMQTKPHDSPGTLVFWRQKSFRNSNGVTPNGGAKCRWGRSKLANFDK